MKLIDNIVKEWNGLKIPSTSNAENDERLKKLLLALIVAAYLLAIGLLVVEVKVWLKL